ncbi:autotransporter outer membrane beta-barrel domain-containing protein [Pseudomonas sp. S2_H01]
MALAIGQQYAVAAPLNGASATVNNGDPVETWQLSNGAVLNVNDASTLAITAVTGSTVILNANASVLATGRALSLNQSVANIVGTRIESTGTFGMVLATDLVGTPGTAANVSDSTVTGIARGISSAYSSLVLSNTQVHGIDNGATGLLNGGLGLVMVAGSADVTNGSQILGDKTGILVVTDPGSPNQTASLTIDNSAVVGTVGSAIAVGSLDSTIPASADITVRNGSSLSGGDGVILSVTNNSTARLTVDNSRLTGDVSIENGSSGTLALRNGASLAGNISNVSTVDVTNNSSTTGNINQAQTLTASNNATVSGNVSNVQDLNVSANSELNANLSGVTRLSLDNSRWTTTDGQGVTDLAMNAGTVKLGSAGGTFETLNVSTLSGSGRFIMDTDLGAHQSDLVNVSGVATGTYDLQITNTGVDPVKGDQDQQVVHTGTGSTAGFAVVGGQVDLGTFAYDLEQRGTDWYLVQKLDDDGGPITTPGTQSVIGLFSAAPTVWYGELSTLRSRMGELRYGKAEGGAWTRAYGNKFNMSAGGGTAYQQNQHGISFGVDAPLPTSDGQWLIGVLAGYSRSDLDIAAGTTGQVDSYYLGAYTTWLSDSGYYIDAVVKANRFKNSSDVRMSDGAKTSGDYNTSGIGASVEAGKHIKLQDNWFVEPFAQISTLWVQGEDYSLDNGMEASSNKADSLLGKVGTTAGRNFPLDKGGYVQPYVKVALAHEFANSNRVKVNDNRFSNDLSGSRAELGAGVAAQLTEVLQLHADVDYSNGKNIEQPWGLNVGLRYNW